MTFLTNLMIATAMNDLQSPFDAHALEKRCLRRYPLAVADEIKRQHASGDPLLYFSAVFAKYVDNAFRGQIAKTRKVDSENLGGVISQNQEWRKLVPVITPPAAVPATGMGVTAPHAGDRALEVQTA